MIGSRTILASAATVTPDTSLAQLSLTGDAQPAPSKRFRAGENGGEVAKP